jgi:hypothetical protein
VDLHFSYLLLFYFDSPSITDKDYNQVSQELYYYFFKYIYAVLPFGSLILLIKLARVKDFSFSHPTSSLSQANGRIPYLKPSRESSLQKKKNSSSFNS